MQRGSSSSEIHPSSGATLPPFPIIHLFALSPKPASKQKERNGRWPTIPPSTPLGATDLPLGVDPVCKLLEKELFLTWLSAEQLVLSKILDKCQISLKNKRGENKLRVAKTASL
uniref:Uncharacterized protein n=1 Tax=Oryzias melastigma TaxID=30732 RepID=A0A3B3B3I9_ORYME